MELEYELVALTIMIFFLCQRALLYRGNIQWQKIMFIRDFGVVADI